VSASGRAAEALADAIDYPLYVVTASSGDEVSGCLAGFVTQCSLNPVCFVVCVSKLNHTFGVARRSAGLAVHLIGADQGDVASLFGEESGDWMDKFSRVGWTAGQTGAPLLAECAAWVEGPVIGTQSAGDHQTFVIEVAAGGAGSRRGSFKLSDATELDAGHPGRGSGSFH
jgi:flavin reductase (DIM6/NTAB) family NADH-FMN oxidoreductase RutF